MTDTWAAKVLADVPRHSLDFCDRMEIDKDGVWMHVDDVLDAIAKLGAGDGLVERLNRADEYEPLGHDGWEAAAHIAALTAQNRELALDVLASSGQAQEAYAAQLAAEAERDALRAKVARLESALREIEADCNAAYPPSHGAIKYAIRLALITETKPQAADQREGGAE